MAQPAPVISPPASTPTSSVVPQPSASAAASTTAPTTAASTATATAQPAKVDLLGDLGGDPFGKKSLLDRYGRHKCAIKLYAQMRFLVIEGGVSSHCASLLEGFLCID